MRVVGCLVLLVTTLSACGMFSGTRPAVPAPGTPVATPAGHLALTAWLPDGWIYTLYMPDLGSNGQIWRAAPGRTATRVVLPDAPGCRFTEYLLPYRMPDGRLGLVRSCSMEDPTQDHMDLVAYRPADGTMEALLSVGLNNPALVSWRNDLTGGYLSYSSGICDGFAPFARQGLVRFPGPTTVDGHTWRLDAPLFSDDTDGCTDQGRATFAVMTPDERRLVFLAAPAAQGHGGQGRLDFPTNVYVQTLPDGAPRALVRDFSDTRGVAMSPDGKHLAIAGRRGPAQGLWIIDLDTATMRKLADGLVSYPCYEPGSGDRISVTFSNDDENHSEMRILSAA